MKIRAADILNVRTLFAFLSEPLKPLNPLKTNAMKPNSTQPFNRITSQLLKVLLLLGVGLFLGQSALAQSTYTWTGGSATSGNWNDAANWGGSLPASPQGYLNFTNTTRINNTNNFAAGSSGFQIYFKAGASSGPFNLYGNSITFYNYGAVDPNIQNEGTNIQTINFPIVDGNGTANSPYGILNVNLNASPGQGPLVFNGTISALDATVAVRALNVSGSNTVTFNGVISDFSSSGKIALSQLGTGKTILTAANTYSGGTTVSGGTLQIGGAGKLNSGSYAGAISIASGATLECSGTNSQTLSGAISGSGVFVKDGALKSDLTLSSTLNTFSGITTITNGRIFVSSQGNLGGGGTIVQTNQGQLYIGAATTLTNSMNLSSIGYPEADALNNFDGAIRSDAASTLAGTITLSGNARIGNYNASGVTFTLSGQITGAYGIEFYGMNGGNNNNRIFLLSNTGNNYAGNTTISCNDFTSARTGCSTILQLGASGVIPDGNGDGNVVFNGADANHLTILEMNGLNETINGLSNVSATGAIIRNTTTGTSMLTIGNANTNSTFSGGITDGGATKSLGITKIGNGTLTLSGASSFVGPTIINAGTLILSGTNTTSGLTTVSAGELIFPIGNTYPNTFASTITVAGAGATNGVLLYSPGSQWVSTGNLTNQTSSVLHVNYSSFSPSTTLAPVKVANLSLGSTLTLRVDGSSSVFYSGQSYPLVTWTASGPANAAGFSTLVLPTGVSGNLSVSGSTLYLNVTANSSQLTWNTGSGNWDTSTANWLSNGIAASYVDGTSAVVFDDAVSASGNPVITNTSAWSPTGVLMKSTSHNYTIGGGAIAGSTSLILDPANTMTLTLTNVNTFTGGTTIAGGTLAIGGAGSLGSGSYAGAIANNGALTYNSSASQTLSGIIQGTGALNYMGAGGLTLSGANTYSGGTTLTNGIVVPGNGSAFGTGTVTANSGVTVYPVASMTIPNAVVLNGGNWRIGGGASHQLSASGAFSVTASSSILADGSTGYGVSGQTGGNWGSAIFLNGALNMGSTTNTLSISGQNGVTINGSVSGTNGTINNYNGGTYLWLANASNPFSGTLRAGGGYIILGYSGANSVYFATLDMNAADAGAFYIANYPLTVGGLMGSRNLTLGGAISIGVNGGSTTYSGNLTNSGSVTKIGTGTLTLSGAVNSTNGVMVGAGTLALSGSASIANANIIVANKAIFDVSALSAAFALGSTQVLTNSTTGAIISGTNNCTVGTLSLVYDGVTPSFIQTNGGMTLSASTAIKINNTAAQLPAGTRILIAAAQSGAKGLVAGALPTPTISGGGAAGAVSLKIDTFGNLDLVVAGTVEEWTGTSSTSWGTPGNWITGVIPGNGSNVVFDAQSTNNLATVLDTGYNLSSLSLYPTPAGAVSIGGTSTLTITNGITLSSGLGQNLTITAPLALGAAQTWMVTNLNTLIVSNVSGSGALTLAGGGTVVMNGANSTTGNNILNGGTTFRATANSAFPSSGTFYVLNNATPSGAGTIDLNGGTVTSTAYVPFMYSTTTILTNGTLIDNAAYTTAGDTHEDYNFMGTINLAPNGNYISNRRFVIGLNSVWIGFTTTINSLNNSTNGSLTWGGDNAGQMNYVGVTAGVAPTLNINGGTVNFNNATVGTGNGYLCIGCNSTTSKGTINLNGANLNAGTWIKMGGNYNAITGQSGTAILTIANGAVGIGGGSDTVYNGVLFMDGGNGDATANTGTSTLSITNATLTVAQIQAGNNGTKTINLNGAIINAGLGASNLFMSAALTVNLQSGGAAFNSGANSIIIGSALGSTGGLTKTGSGLLTLTNANTYSGLTTINLGELKFSTVGSGASTITTAGSATNGVLVASAGGQWVTTGSLTNQTSSTLHIDYNSTTPSTTTAPLKVASFVPGTGLTMLVSGGAFTAGQNYPLVTWTGSGPSNTNAFTALVLPHGAGYLSVSGSTLYLNVTASTEPLTWNTGNGNWDTSTANWVDSTLASSAYIDGLDQVVFDDATGATGNPSVTLNSTLSPASVTIKSTSHNYTIGGTGGIGGSTSLTLDPANTKTLILATTNTYTGSTTIGGGKLLITGTLGSGNYAGAIAISNSASLEYSNSAAQTFSGPITGAGALTIDPSGNVGFTLSSIANTYSGLTTISNAVRLSATPSQVSTNSAFVIVGNSSGGGQWIVGAGGSIANNFTISGTGNFSGTGGDTTSFGPIRCAGNAFSGTITLAGNARIGQFGTGSNNFSGQITGSYGPEFAEVLNNNNATATWLLGNTGTANNYTGNTTISALDYGSARTGLASILEIGASGQIPYGPGYGIVVFNGADANHLTVLELNANNVTLNGVSNVSAAGAIIRNTSTGASTLTIGAGDTNSSYSGFITDGGAGKTLGIAKIGTGTLVLSGANVYTGGTTNSAGILEADSNQALGTGLLTMSGGTLSNNVSATLTNAVNLYAAGTIGVGSGQIFTLSGIITNTGALTKTGAGTLTLSAANTYSGNTTLSAGSLALGASQILPLATTVNLAGGTLALSSFNNTVNALQSSGSILAKGTWGSSSSAANHISASMTGTGILTVSTGGASTSVVTSSANPVNYGTVTFTNKVTGSSGDGSAPSGTVTFYDGATPIGAGTLVGSSGTVSTYTLTINSLTVGTHNINASYAGNASYDVSMSGVLSQVVIPATSTATVTVNNSATYDGSAHAATVALSGTNTIGSVTPILTGGAATQTAAGTYAVTATFVPVNTNYTTLTGLSAGNFTISNAPGTTFSNLNSVTNRYGTTNIVLSGTISATGPVYPAIGELVSATINGAITVTGAVIDGAGDFSINTNSLALGTNEVAGSPYIITYNYAGNLAAASDASTTLTVTNAPLTITANNDSKTYDGNAYTTNNGVTYAGFVNGETNTALTGSLTFTGSAEGAITAGSYTLTPTNYTSTNYLINYVSGTLTINPATPVITALPAASTITYGQPLSAAGPTGGSATTAGSFAFTTPGTVPPLGTALYGVTFTPTDVTDYTTATTNVSVTVVPACTSPTIIGGISPASLTATVGDQVVLTLTNVTGTSPFGYEWLSNTVMIASATNSSYTNLSVTVADAGNYQVIVTNDCGSITSSVAVLAVNPQTPVIATVPTATTSIIYGQSLSAAGLTGGSVTNAAGVTVPGSFAYTSPGTTPGAGTAAQGVIFTPTDTTDYTTVSTNVSVTVTPAGATATLVLNNPTVIYNGSGFVASVSVTASNTPGSVQNILVGGQAFQTNAGSYLVTADYVPTDTVNYSSLTGVAVGSLVINPGTSSVNLTGTAFIYDGTAKSPAISVSGSTGAISTNYAGTGSTSYGSAAAPVAAGTYALTVGVISDVNWIGATNSLNFTNSPATVTLNLVSSAPTNGYLGSVLFTATNLPADATSNVVFSANGTAFSTNTVANGGTTSLALSTLPRGTNLITAVYAGDNNYLTSSASLNQVVTNHPPVAASFALGALSGTPVTVQIIGGKYAPTDADGDTVTVSAVQNPSAQNGTVSTDGTNITYTATNTFAGTDTFTYSVSDGYGGTNTATITANVVANGSGFNLISGPVITGGTGTITFAGIPNYQYALETATNLSLPILWTPLVTNTANSTNGNLSFTFSTGSGSGYFRTRYVP